MTGGPAVKINNPLIILYHFSMEYRRQVTLYTEPTGLAPVIIIEYQHSHKQGNSTR